MIISFQVENPPSVVKTYAGRELFGFLNDRLEGTISLLTYFKVKGVGKEGSKKKNLK